MLCLSGKPHDRFIVEIEENGETKIIGTVVVIESRGGKTKIGFDLPKELKIYREDLYKQMGKTPPPNNIWISNAEHRRLKREQEERNGRTE